MYFKQDIYLLSQRRRQFWIDILAILLVQFLLTRCPLRVFCTTANQRPIMDKRSAGDREVDRKGKRENKVENRIVRSTIIVCRYTVSNNDFFYIAGNPATSIHCSTYSMWSQNLNVTKICVIYECRLYCRYFDSKLFFYLFLLM